MMTGRNERFRPIGTAPEWSHEVFDTCAELAELLERHSYRFARTMPGAPHSYTLKRTWPAEDEFVEPLLSNTVSTAATGMDPTCNKR